MELITNINNAINGFVWGLPMLVLLLLWFVVGYVL